jgi:hypothetical protein
MTTTSASTTETHTTDDVVVDYDDTTTPRGSASLDWSSLRYIAGWYVLSRCAVLLLAQAAVWANSPVSVYNALTGWDSSWYGGIATHGYPSSAHGSPRGNIWAFFPAWPALLHVAHVVAGGSWQRNAIALNFVLGFTAALCLWLVVANVFDRPVADRTVVLFLFMPSAFTLSMAYTESLFITVSALCLYALRRKWWLVAGLAAAVASGTRIPGIVLVACCAWAAGAELVRGRGRGRYVALLAPLLAPMGLVGFMAVVRAKVGNATEFLSAEKVWNNRPRWGMTVVDIMRRVLLSSSRWSSPGPLAVAILVLFVAAGFVFMFLQRDRIPFTWWIFAVGIVAFAIAPRIVGPRYLLPAFPPVAALIARLPVRWFVVVVATSAAMMSVLTMLSFGAGGYRMAP